MNKTLIYNLEILDADTDIWLAAPNRGGSFRT